MAKVGSVKNFIKSLYYSNKPIKNAKDPLSHINVKTQDEYVGEMVRINIPYFAEYAEKHGLKVNIAQKKDLLLINSGIYTDTVALKNSTPQNILDSLLGNIKKNFSAKNI